MEQECHQIEDFIFIFISKLVKISYIKIDQFDYFNILVQHILRLSATVNSVYIQNELLQQPFVNNVLIPPMILLRIRLITNVNI